MWSRGSRARIGRRNNDRERGINRRGSVCRPWLRKGHRTYRSFNSDFPPAPRELYKRDNTRLTVKLVSNNENPSDAKSNANSRLMEIDVGVTEYISDLDGFTGALKSRFSDFHVNEIDLDGNVARLTDLSVPKDQEREEEDEEELLKRYRVEHLPTETWDRIHEMIETKNKSEIVEIDVTTQTKEQRTKIHEAVKTVFGARVVGSTITKDDKKLITFKLFNKNERIDRRQKWPTSRAGEYVHFLVYKENIDTIEVSFKLGELLSMRAQVFTYAGVKDRRAKTTQWFCLRKFEPKLLLERTKLLPHIHVGNFTFKANPLKLGQLSGNRFRIAIRNVTAEDRLVNRALDSLKTHGFINYYGLQRFGNCKEVPTYKIGLQLLLGNWKQAVELILKPRQNEYDPKVAEAKRIYQTSKDASKAYSCLKKKRQKSVEEKLLAGLMRHSSNDYVNALENVPRNMRLLYIHAYQSLIWNQIVSKRLKLFGLKPIVGDLVFAEDSYDNSEVLDTTENSIDIDENETSDKSETDKEPMKRINVKVLTDKDLSQYTVYDVVLPLPGYDVTYPENIVKHWYRDLLTEDGLSLEMPKQKVKLYTLSGAYRKMVERAMNLSWSIMHYNDSTDNLIRSDYEEMMGEPEPQNVENGKFKALVIDFCLSSSCYATMALREVMKMDTSSETHIKFDKITAAAQENKHKLETETNNECSAKKIRLETKCSPENTKKIELEETTGAPENEPKIKIKANVEECDTKKRKLESTDSVKIEHQVKIKTNEEKCDKKEN